jgi:hypothetical protein
MVSRTSPFLSILRMFSNIRKYTNLRNMNLNKLALILCLFSFVVKTPKHLA